jgi:tryptophan halogenase
MIGQGILPRAWHPAVDQLGDAELKQLMDDVQRVIAACVDAMPTHQQFIARCCAAV